MLVRIIRQLCLVRKGSALQAHRDCSSYVQGQTGHRNTREYFYFIDHQGQLFLDDAKMKNFTSCYKEKDFLRFFFKRLKFNKSNKYPEFPYISPCGPEMNYVRCDDLPIVFTKVLTIEGEIRLSYNNGDEKLTFPFTPSGVCMLPGTGRVYHPGPEALGGVGLVKSLIAIEWSNSFSYEEGAVGDRDSPTHFTWQGEKHRLSGELYETIERYSGLS
ncbi:UPF0598 protein CG30010-like [Watersipora subatra]|uniref:UPF0598 protein CG30010-like n=1 Tax=Watersipora subatra TaxID=2589382 RepID=UPI00355C7C0A